ncbi:MAG: cysteine hydrolase [Acidimicrobiaceae bacterium]|nr:cysteine hydrolase [Acidimicrobiaceae bacterium]
MDGPSCLLAIDVQFGFVCAETEAVPSAVRSLCERVAFEHRVFTRWINPGPGGPFVDFLDYHGFQGDAAEIPLTDEVADLATMVVDKYTYSPFVGTDLERSLRELDVRTVVVCGIDTAVCVLSAAVGLFDRGFRPLLVSDASASMGGPDIHQAGLDVLARTIGPHNIVTGDDLAARWGEMHAVFS